MKMIARHHFMVHWTAGTRRVFEVVSELLEFSVSEPDSPQAASNAHRWVLALKIKFGFRMINHILPADTRGRKLWFLSLFFIGYLYLLRVEYTESFLGMMGTWLGVFFFLTPIFWLMGLILHIIFVSVYIFKARSHFSLGLFLVGGLLLARFLPVPPTPEEISFSWQRTEYDQIVELAHNNQLQQGDECLAENQFLPSSSYYQWSSNCIYVYHPNGLIVEFAPRSLERPIVFVENPTSGRFPPCWSEHESRVFKQLSEHWYICKRFFYREE